MNADIEGTIKHCLTCLEYQNTQLQEKPTPHEALAKLLAVVGTNIFMMNNENVLCGTVSWDCIPPTNNCN